MTYGASVWWKVAKLLGALIGLHMVVCCVAALVLAILTVGTVLGRVEQCARSKRRSAYRDVVPPIPSGKSRPHSDVMERLRRGI